MKTINTHKQKPLNTHKKKPLVAGELGHLSELKIGQSGRILALHCDNLALRRRLYEMGLTQGIEVTIKKIAPLGDPYSVELRGYELCIRKKDLASIDIEVVQ